MLLLSGGGKAYQHLARESQYMTKAELYASKTALFGLLGTLYWSLILAIIPTL